MKFNSKMYNELFHPAPAEEPQGGGIKTPEPKKQEEAKQAEPAEPSEPSEPEEPDEPEGGDENNAGRGEPSDE